MTDKDKRRIRITSGSEYLYLRSSWLYQKMLTTVRYTDLAFNLTSFLNKISEITTFDTKTK
jgi:hypothetical protein